MALKFGEASFEQFERGEGKENLQIEPLLDGSNVEVSSPNPPKIANPDELTSCWGIIKPVGLVLQNGEWTFVSSHASYVADSLFLRGDRFEETPCGIFELRAGERKSKLTNANVRIDSIRDVYIDDENKETFLVCAVSCREAWGDEEKLIEISSKNYKSVFKKIREEFRDVQLSTQSMDALDEYLSKVNQRDAKDDGIDLPHEVRSLYTG